MGEVLKVSGAVRLRFGYRAPMPLAAPADAPERTISVLESVLGATPHEFESRILRHSPGVAAAGQSLVPTPGGTNGTRGSTHTEELPRERFVSV
jgi:hypothetical protein